MLYYYLRLFNYIFIVFGMKKSFINILGKPDKISIWDKLWSTIVLISIISYYIFTKELGFSLNKKELYLFYKTNNSIVNAFVIILNLVNGQEVCAKLYKCILTTLGDLRITENNIKMFTIKLYFAMTIPTTILITFFFLEIIISNPYVILVSMPTYLSTFHLVLHLSILLATLKVVKLDMIDKLTLDRDVEHNTSIEEIPSKWKQFKYVIDPDIKFMDNQRNDEHFDLKFLCKVYDSHSTCIKLLEQHHGIQMLLTFWLIFTNAVFGVTMIACNYVDFPILLVGRSIIPFMWCFYGCYINEQMSKEVEDIDLLIVKYLIDFRCDGTRKAILQTFKQLVNTNRLQFTASSLFHLNYSMILGLIVNIITYSIILIQLFSSDNN